MSGGTHEIFLSDIFDNLVPKLSMKRLARSLACQENMEYGRVCCVCGYHVYRDIWGAAVGEVLTSERQLQNTTDRQ